MTKDVHTEHCCLKHGGCKYGDKFCTVTRGIKKQSFPCEDCGPFDFLSNEEKSKLLFEMIDFENNEGKSPTPEEIKKIQTWIDNGLIWNLKRNLLNVFLLVQSGQVRVPDFNDLA
jgi:hypothetical protein